MQTFSATLDQARAHGHRNKCVVVAASILFDMDYIDAYKAIEDECYPRSVPKNSGYYQWEWKPAFARLAAERGLKFELIPLAAVRRFAKTTKSFDRRAASRLNIGSALIQSRGHVSAYANGKVEDWADTRQKIIKKVFMVTPATAPETVNKRPMAKRPAQDLVLMAVKRGATIDWMCEEFDISPATVRTKLSRLRRAGHNIVRTGKVYKLNDYV